MGDRSFHGFQCLNKTCTNFIFVDSETPYNDFEVRCPACGFIHRAGETATLYDYELINEKDDSVIETGPFQILHEDHLQDSQEFKYCIVCGALKPLDAFDRHRSRRTGRQGECRVCKHVYNSIKNQTRLAEQHREASQKRRLYTHFEDPSKVDIAAIYRRFDSKCFRCEADLSDDLTAGGVQHRLGNLDHTLPVYFLWPLTTGNATLLCREHNGEKAEKWPRDYYRDSELRRLSTLTGLTYPLLAGEPQFNPSALQQLKDATFVERLFARFAAYPNEILRLRNRILDSTSLDFLETSPKLSKDWRDKAEDLRA